MMKVFLDSNVLFSIAYDEKGKSKYDILFFLNKKSNIKVFISTLVKREVTKNIKLKKPNHLRRLKRLLLKTTILPDTVLNLPSMKNLPEIDKIILSTAIKNKITYFLTGNTKHFNRLYNKRIKTTLILEPNAFYDQKY